MAKYLIQPLKPKRKPKNSLVWTWKNLQIEKDKFKKDLVPQFGKNLLKKDNPKNKNVTKNFY
jgi:hypothetical protein